MDHWHEKYVGRKFKDREYDCGHLAIDVLNNEFGKDLEIVARTYNNMIERNGQLEAEVERKTIRVTQPEEGDVVLMSSRGSLVHIGVYFELNGTPYVIHAVSNVGSVIVTPIAELRMLALPVEGYYRVQ